MHNCNNFLKYVKRVVTRIFSIWTEVVQWRERENGETVEEGGKGEKGGMWRGGSVGREKWEK